MARLILKSPYIKSTGGAAGYLRYIAMRERVEILPDDRPPTRKQEQLIAKLVKDFPTPKPSTSMRATRPSPPRRQPPPSSPGAGIQLGRAPTVGAVSEVYRHPAPGGAAGFPRAVRRQRRRIAGKGDGGTGAVHRQCVAHIISLKREDAARLGFDNAAAWRNLIRAHRNEIAAAMKIPPADFRWYAAFHDEGEHPHVHMMAWSVKPGQAYLSKEGIRQIKSRLTNDIFRDEMLHLYEQKSESRDELVRQARRAMLELVQAMRDGLCDHPEAEQLMQELAAGLGTVKGKKSYSYLPKRLKQLVDEIVDQMERLSMVRQCYDQWLLLQGKVDSYYHDKPRERLPLSKEKEFRQIKNAVVREAERLRLGQITFEDQDMDQRDEPEQFQNAPYAYWTLREVIRNEELTLEERRGAVSELEKLAKGGDRYSQYLLGKLWQDGPLLIPDGVKARYWFEQAARQGHPAAQYALAKLYLSDDLEVRDTARGMDWLRTAAEGGNSWAMYRLGKELLRGEITEQDAAGAVEWLTRSAEGGNPYAQYLLGKLYLMGKEVPQDEEQAILWLTRSAEQGNEYARYLLDHREEQRPPDVMLAVTRLLYHMSRVFQDNSLPRSRPGGIQIDRKRLRKLWEKKIAQGHKPDDHEEQQPEMTM